MQTSHFDAIISNFYKYLPLAILLAPCHNSRPSAWTNTQWLKIAWHTTHPPCNALLKFCLYYLTYLLMHNGHVSTAGPVHLQKEHLTNAQDPSSFGRNLCLENFKYITEGFLPSALTMFSGCRTQANALILLPSNIVRALGRKPYPTPNYSQETTVIKTVWACCSSPGHHNQICNLHDYDSLSASWKH